MKFNKLGQSDLEVSSYCLGSMTWGEATSEDEGHWQLDFSIENGINFVDTAEMYPTNPLRKETAGNTEKIIGNWINKRKKRDDIIIATKVVGIGNKTVRNGQAINKSTMEEALTNSLKKLKTDSIDIFYLNKPNNREIKRNHLVEFCQKMIEKGLIKSAGIIVGSESLQDYVYKDKSIKCFSFL